MNKKTWITGRFVFFMFLIVFGLVFTQALRSSASAVLFLFLLILPILTLLYVIIGRAAVKVYVEVDNTRVEKDTDVSYEIKIINDSFLPFPFVEAHISVPEDNGVRCVEQRMMIPLVPFGCRIVKHSVKFHYRGQYEIGVLDMRIKDPLGLFSANLGQSVCHTIIVFPRMLEISSPHENSTTELPTDLTRRAISTERSEQANIRNYVGGDSLKDIHWKLSSKMEDLLVRDYNTNNTRQTYIIADLNAPKTELEAKVSEEKPEKKKKVKKSKKDRKKERAAAKQQRKQKKLKKPKTNKVRAEVDKKYVIESVNGKELSAKRRQLGEEIARAVREAEQPQESTGRRIPELRPEIVDQIGEQNCDRVIELSIAAALRELRSGGTVTLIYNDTRTSSGISSNHYPDTMAFASEILTFACAPVDFKGQTIHRMASAIDETQNLTVRIVTANLSPSDVSDYIALSASLGGGGSDTSVELYLADTPEAYTNPVDRAVYTAAMREELGAAAVKVSLFEESVMPDGTIAFVKEDE